MVKHYLYSKELKNLSKIGCEISVADIRKYFGRESASGTKNGIIHSMFYWFNDINNDNCNPTQVFGTKNPCNLLIYKISENQKVKEVIFGFF